MRIAGGIAKGKKVDFKKAFTTKGKVGELRPTSAKVRQAIFNILGERIIDSRFLDLYAGTGAVGIEALSRGAGEVTFVDDNAMRVDVIKKLIERFGFKDRAVVIRGDARYFLDRITQDLKLKTQRYFDIIFVDPPYASKELEIVLPMIDEKEILMDNGIVIAEHSSKKTLMTEIEKLRLIRTYKYGDTSLTLYRKERI